MINDSANHEFEPLEINLTPLSPLMTLVAAWGALGLTTLRVILIFAEDQRNDPTVRRPSDRLAIRSVVEDAVRNLKHTCKPNALFNEQRGAGALAFLAMDDWTEHDAGARAPPVWRRELDLRDDFP